MPKPILTVEELDLMWSNGATSEPDYGERMARVEDSLRELWNKRTRVKTLDDAMDAYDALIKDAHKTIANGFAEQAATLRAIGRARSGNTQWRMDRLGAAPPFTKMAPGTPPGGHP